MVYWVVYQMDVPTDGFAEVGHLVALDRPASVSVQPFDQMWQEYHGLPQVLGPWSE